MEGFVASQSALQVTLKVVLQREGKLYTSEAGIIYKRN